jgi:ribosomal protein S18 acetylase RimI-like enzyme
MDELLTLTGNDPFIRAVGGPQRGPAWHSADARAIAYRGSDGAFTSVMALGPPDHTAELVLRVRAEHPEITHVIVPRGTPVALGDAIEWNFRAAYAAPPPQPAEDVVAWHEDSDAITGLLSLAYSGSTVWPGDGRARRWAAIHEDGRLVACLADTTTLPGVGHLSSIAVHPATRGRALGPSITAWAMRRLFEDGCDVVGLGVFSANTVGRRMYDRLGFAVDHAMTSGALVRAQPHTAP